MVTKLQSQIPYIQDELPIHIPMFFYAVHPFDIHTAFEGHFVKMGDQRLMQKPSCFIWIFKHLLRGSNEPLSLQEGRRVIDIHTKYEEQQLLIQSGAWTSSSLPESSRIVTTTSASVEGPTVGGGGGGGYQNPVFNLEAGGEGVWHGEEVAGQRYEYLQIQQSQYWRRLTVEQQQRWKQFPTFPPQSDLVLHFHSQIRDSPSRRRGRRGQLFLPRQVSISCILSKIKPSSLRHELL